MGTSFARRAAALACTALVIVCSVQCTSSSATSPPASTTPTSSNVGAAGGKVTSSDAMMEVSIPAGALPKDVTVTVEVVSAPPPGAIGRVYEIGPTGTTFTAPITMTFHYGGLDLGGSDASQLRVATDVAGGWQPLTGTAEDTSNQTVSGTTTHFSKYTIVPGPAPPRCTDPTLKACADASTPPPTGPCGPSTCIHGCCSGDTCVEMATQAMCGIAGQQCSDCSPGPCYPNPSDGLNGGCSPPTSK